MGSSLPGGFALRAGDGAFAVAAFPNAIDRSLHLRAPDAPTTLCHRLQGIPTRIAVRVWLEGTLIRGSVLVGITTATGSRLMGAVMSDAGMVEFHGARQAVSIGRPNAAQWYDIHLRVSPNGRAAVIMEDDGGSELGRAAVNLVYPIDAQEICFALPAGEPDAELFIDDLRITY
jgi:hypothetical protein